MRIIIRILLYLFALIGFILVAGYASVEFGLTKTPGIVDTQHDYYKNQLYRASTTESWNQDEEWTVLREAILKDKADITMASKEAGINPRLLVSILIVEQLRLFHSNRELFKSAFAPLKILAIQSQFSWGVMGIKQETAREIENHLKDSTSPWYLGTQFEHLLDFSSNSPDNERFTRLTSEDSRYYSYLYAALHIRQLEKQWERAGVPLTDRPEIIATLYDLGFARSKPHPNPLSGGAEIEIGRTTYSFGGLAKRFYDSDELQDLPSTKFSASTNTP